MSEPQHKITMNTQATSPSVDELSRGEEFSAPSAPVVPSAPTAPTTTTATTDQPTELSGPVKTLKDAFPDLDVEVIETILDSQGGNLDAAFEVLLGMSDPTYKPSPSEIAQQSESQNQLRKDEEYARRLAREGDAHYPQNNTDTDSQPLFNFQEELPIIKEKVIEAGTAAKNKIMNLYNQFMAGPNNQGESSRESGVLESRMGNLSLGENQQQRPNPPPKKRSVDLYEWDGQGQVGQNQENSSPVRNPLLSQKDNATATTTPVDQMLSDEEFARRLASEDDEATAAAAAVAEVAHNNHSTTSPIKPSSLNDSDNGEVTFSALHSTSPSKEAVKPSGYTAQDDDDLDDLFDKHDSIPDLKVEEEKLESSEQTSKN